MSQPFHDGELPVQKRAGVSGTASRVGGSIHSAIPRVAAEFLAARTWVVVATVDDDVRPWASLLSGLPGFIEAEGAGTVRIRAVPAPGDPLGGNLRTGAHLGLLAPDLETRRRMRVNGRIDSAPDGTILLHTDQVYANCPKYIHPRVEQLSGQRPEPTPRGRRTRLTGGDRNWIREADTFFVATVNPGEGADASHRGGAPGFMHLTGDRLTWPDFKGNAMFNTLGNIARWPRAGVVILDWASGATLQITGRAEIDWDPVHAAKFADAERLVHLTIEELVETAGVMPPIVGRGNGSV